MTSRELLKTTKAEGKTGLTLTKKQSGGLLNSVVKICQEIIPGL